MKPYVLDTDTLTLLQHGHSSVCQNVARHPPTEIATTVITVEEPLSGWYTLVRRVQQRDPLAVAYIFGASRIFSS